MSKGKNTKGFLLGALAGSVIGSVTALLLAPKSGKELRQDIAVESKKAYETTSKAASQAYKATGSFARQVGDKTQAAAGKTKGLAQHITGSIRDRMLSKTLTNTGLADADTATAATGDDESSATVVMQAREQLEEATNQEELAAGVRAEMHQELETHGLEAVLDKADVSEPLEETDK